MNEAMTKYGETDPVSYNIGGTVWRIFDQPESGRLMITPSLEDVAGKSTLSGMTFGIADAGYKQRQDFEPAAAQFLASKGCRITGGHLIVTPQYEFEYVC